MVEEPVVMGAPPGATAGAGMAPSAPEPTPGLAPEQRAAAAPVGPSAADIEAWRRRIDEIDQQLSRLLNSRSACAVEIGRIKRVLGLPVYSPEREAQVLERVARENPGPLDARALRRVFERIIDESRRLERVASADGPAEHETEAR
jgi:chorismate mutase